jgi:hypothetical protein
MYKINSTEIKETMFWANVTYTLEDGTEVTKDVAIDTPQSKEDVLNEISNREIGEQETYSKLKALSDIKAEIDATIEKKVPVNETIGE